MAISIKQADATVAIRAATTVESIDATVALVIGYLFPAASAMVVEYAPDAPDAVHNAALVRLLGWMYDADPSDPGIGRAMMVSGAAPLLGPWRVHRAGAIGTVDGTPGGGDVPAGTGLPPAPAEGTFTLFVDNGTLRWVQFPIPPTP